MKHTKKELWDFVNRADTKEKIDIATKWLRNHFDDFRKENEVDFWDELMRSLAWKYRDINYQERLKDYKPCYRNMM